jgi:hypothetical protein
MLFFVYIYHLDIAEIGIETHMPFYLNKDNYIMFIVVVVVYYTILVRWHDVDLCLQDAIIYFQENGKKCYLSLANASFSEGHHWL